MADQPRGALCPECGTALDTRKDDPIAERNSSFAIGLMVSAIGLMPFVGSLALFFAVLAHYRVRKQHTLTAEYRVSADTKRKRVVVRWLTYAWACEILIMLVISHYWPNAFNWW
ncbi:MAG: hypothetical protein ACF8LL_05450 [Phycisphaerales bacterium]